MISRIGHGRHYIHESVSGSIPMTRRQSWHCLPDAEAHDIPCILQVSSAPRLPWSRVCLSPARLTGIMADGGSGPTWLCWRSKPKGCNCLLETQAATAFWLCRQYVNIMSSHITETYIYTTFTKRKIFLNLYYCKRFIVTVKIGCNYFFNNHNHYPKRVIC